MSAKRVNIARILSLIATALCVYGFYLSSSGTVQGDNGSLHIFLGMFLGMISYCFCGFLSALCTPFSLSRWGFFLAPFPLNLLYVCALFIFGIVAVFTLPVFPVFRRARELGY